jgi:hypothetical protein
MKYARGNIWTIHNPAPVCITTNGIIKNDGTLVMGAGIALQAKQRFPELPGKLADAVSQHGNHTLYMPDENIFSFPTKHDWKDKSDLALIAQSATELLIITEKVGFTEVYLPKPGCANGQLDWEDVKNVISVILDDRFTVVIL